MAVGEVIDWVRDWCVITDQKLIFNDVIKNQGDILWKVSRFIMSLN